MTLEELSSKIQRSLRRSRSVEIAGLGVFEKDDSGNILFHHPFRHPHKARIFISYAKEDAKSAERLFRELTSKGYTAWLDNHKLLPGQNWQQRIEDAIASADFFIACFSSKSVNKRGAFQVEIRHALHFADSLPLDQVFFIPVRLDACRIPLRITRETQYVDLFPGWDEGFGRVLDIVEMPKPIAA